MDIVSKTDLWLDMVSTAKCQVIFLSSVCRFVWSYRQRRILLAYWFRCQMFWEKTVSHGSGPRSFAEDIEGDSQLESESQLDKTTWDPCKTFTIFTLRNSSRGRSSENFVQGQNWAPSRSICSSVGLQGAKSLVAPCQCDQLFLFPHNDDINWCFLDQSVVRQC